MLTITQLENELRIQYPSSISDETQAKRLHNIRTLQEYIGGTIDAEALSFGEKERRLLFFTTNNAELISIQYPGKESDWSEARERSNSVRKYDFRPKIELPSGEMIRDLTFADQWSAVESINSGHNNIMKALTTVFFHIGRMTRHQLMPVDISYETIDGDGNVMPGQGGTIQLELYVPVFSEEVMQTLNYNCDGVTVDGTAISFEAYLYFFALLIENEDSKYYDKKHDLSSGRITTSDSMLLLASYFSENISLSDLLQAFVSGNGAAKCQVSAIPDATGGLVEIVDRPKQLQDELDRRGIIFRKSSYITISGVKFHTYIKIPSKKVAVLSKGTYEDKAALQEKGWRVFFKNEIVNNDSFAELIGMLD